MKLNITKCLFIAVTLFISVFAGFSQGFVNLDFEAAKNLGSPGSFTQLSSADVFPGWTVSANYIVYNDFSLSGGSLSIMDTNPPYGAAQPIQGKYFALLVSANLPGVGIPISLGQTGQIPLLSQSISFWGVIGGMQVTFNNQPLLFSITGSTANYNIYTADISAFAGQAGQLLFTLPPYVANSELDNIQFSSSPVPEPSAFYLSALGGLFFARRCTMTTSPRPAAG